MKNSQVVTRYLDRAEERTRQFDAAMRAATAEEMEREFAAMAAQDEADRALWFACLDAGWTIAELDAAYERRTGYRVKRG